MNNPAKTISTDTNFFCMSLSRYLVLLDRNRVEVDITEALVALLVDDLRE
jgi:hypothetical protein